MWETDKIRVVGGHLRQGKVGGRGGQLFLEKVLEFEISDVRKFHLHKHILIKCVYSFVHPNGLKYLYLP